MSAPLSLGQRAVRVKLAIDDPATLGLSVRRDGSSRLVLCPAHLERTPSCSVRVRERGILFHCFGCGFGGDILTVIATQYGLDTRRQFRQVVELAEDLAGIARDDRSTTLPPLEAPPPSPSPPVDEIREFYGGSCRPARSDLAATEWLDDVRGIDADRVEERDLARVVPRGTRVPRWARSASGTWPESSHRVITPTFDETGLVSVTARALLPHSAKSLGPAGFRKLGVFADPLGRRMLAGQELAGWDGRVIVAEGEPDFFTWATHWGDADVVPAVFGVSSGTWTPAIADRIPDGARVFLRTHRDTAGDRYAAEIARTLIGRCEVLR